jgi:hypothetical protein
VLVNASVHAILSVGIMWKCTPYECAAKESLIHWRLMRLRLYHLIAFSSAVVNGDESIPKHERREVYSHTFFHIRQQYHLFERLHKGHKCILTTIHRQCVEVREQEGVLNSAYQSTDSLTQHIYHM